MAIPIALGIGRAVLGWGEAARQKKREEGLIQAAYGRGRSRLDLEQLDTRQGVAESAVQRGIAGGGGVRVGGPAPTSDETRTWQGDRWSASRPYSVAGGTDLGSQQGLDLGREQRLQQDELVAQRESALSGVRSSYEQSVIGAVSGGIAAGTEAAGTLNEAGVGGGGAGTGSRLPTGQPAADTPAAGGAVAAAYGAPSPAAAAGYSNAWGGLHPTQPWGVGGGSARQGDGTNASFNVVGGG